MREILKVGREVVPIVAVALLVCHLIRSHLLEWYLVPSSSMQPTLHGDPVHGDLVLVDKTAFWFREPRRFEMVVLRNPEDPPRGHLVKRIVAWGDDEESVVLVDEGDVFLGRSRQSLQRCVKPPLEAALLRQTHFAFPEVGVQKVADYFRGAGTSWSVQRGENGSPHIALSAGAPDFESLTAVLADRSRPREGASPADLKLPGHFSTREPVDTTFLDDAGERRGGAEEAYPDIGMELDLTVGPDCLGVQMVMEFGGRCYALQYGRDGRVRWLDGSIHGAEGEEIPHSGAPLCSGESATLEFGYLDGHVFLIVQSELLFHRALSLAVEQLPAVPLRERQNLLHVAVVGGPAELDRVRVFHDVYYQTRRAPFGPPPTPVELEPGELFLLGDNTFESRDSRSGRAFPRADLVGMPLAVIGPVSRMRWLVR